MGAAEFHGEVAAGYEAIAETMVANLEPSVVEGSTGPRSDPGDLGAAVCIIHGGETVVDGWVGRATPANSAGQEGRPWQRDTLVNIYSVGKSVAAVLALDAVVRGELELDEPLVSVWPELEQHHGSTTLRHMLTHGGALPAVAHDLHDGDILDWTTMCGALAATPPWWEPGTAHGYHVNTYGFLAGEPVCRVSGQSFADALRGRITGPRQLDLHIGLTDHDLPRCADIDIPGANTVADGGALGSPDWPEHTAEQRMMKRSYFNPRTMSGMGIVNSAGWRKASVPSTNGHATARGVAGFYAALLPNAPDPLLPPELLRETTSLQVGGIDRVIGRETRFGIGFQMHQDERPIGTSARAYGHFGFGGSLGFADPEHDLAFAYLMNRPGDRWQNPRTVRLLDAVRRLLGKI